MTARETVASSGKSDGMKWEMNYKIDMAEKYGVPIIMGDNVRLNMHSIDTSLEKVSKVTGIYYMTMCREMNDARRVAFPRK
jgi:hypothetical protein